MLALDLDLNTQVQYFVFFLILSCDWLLCTETWWFAHCGQIQVHLGEQPDYLLETKWRGIGFGENERESLCITLSKETVGRKEGTMCWKHMYSMYSSGGLTSCYKEPTASSQERVLPTWAPDLAKVTSAYGQMDWYEQENEQRGEWQCQNAITQRRKPRYISSY